MSDFAVEVVALDNVMPHPKPEVHSLDLAQIGGYNAVVARSTGHKAGDLVVYIPEDSLVPENILEPMGLTNRLSGPLKNRVKAIRLQGELSQGVVMPRHIFETLTGQPLPPAGTDVAELLGITKYEQPIPAQLAGKVTGRPKWLPVYDIENIKKPTYLKQFVPGEAVFVTEKIHGTNCAVFMSRDALHPIIDDGSGIEMEDVTFEIAQQFDAPRMGVASRNYALQYDENNTYWRAALSNDMSEKLKRIFRFLHGGVEHIAVFGEVFGKGIQDLGYGFDKPQFRAFDILIVDGAGARYLDYNDFRYVCDRAKIETVPILYEGPFDYSAILDFATNKSALDGKLREGVVVRPEKERNIFKLRQRPKVTNRHTLWAAIKWQVREWRGQNKPVDTGKRLVAKAINPDYLLRKGGTEFQ